jgi:hypothetical protein
LKRREYHVDFHAKKAAIFFMACEPNPATRVKIRVVNQIGIFWLVSVGISWYLPYQYRRKSWSVHFGNIFLAGTPFFLEKGAVAPFLRKKGGTGPLFDTASPSFVEKRSSRQISNTDRKYRPPSKSSDTGKIPIPKKLLVTPWYTTLVVTGWSYI